MVTIFGIVYIISLDISVQVQTLTLLKNLQLRFDLSFTFIINDLSVVQHPPMADKAALMYLGNYYYFFIKQSFYIISQTLQENIQR